MAKKELFLFFLVLLAIVGLSSFCDGENVLILNYDPPVNDNGGGSRSSTIPIYVEQSDHTLTFSTNYAECAVILSDEDNCMVFSDYVGIDGIVSIDESFTGVFKLRLIVGDSYYSAEIEL